MERNVIRFDPLSDSVFSCIFADESTKIAMLEIINAVLTDAGDAPVRAITKMDSQYSLIAEHIGVKGGRLDVRAVAEDGELFDIEVQLRGQAAMNDRSWFYGSKLMSDAFREGEEYRRIPRVRVINLLDFVLREAHDDYLQPIGVMYRKRPEIASDAFRIYNIELPKFRAKYHTLESVKGNPLAQWLYLLEQGYKDEREMEVLTEMTEGMKAFAKKYNRSLDDPKLRGLYELDMSARRDRASELSTARQEGMEAGRTEGIREGRREAQVEMIRGWLKRGFTEEQIAALMDDPQDVAELIADARGEIM